MKQICVEFYWELMHDGIQTQVKTSDGKHAFIDNLKVDHLKEISHSKAYQNSYIRSNKTNDWCNKRDAQASLSQYYFINNFHGALYNKER